MTSLLLDGAELFYRMPRGRGDGKDQVLTLLIHGAGGSSRHWEPLLEHLPERFCPLLIDLPGHGRSGGTAPRSIDQAVTTIARFLDLLGIQQPLWCVGHSMGGLLAQSFALRFRARIEGLVLIATATRIRLHSDFVCSMVSGNWDLEMFRPSFGADVPLDIQNLVLAEYPKMRAEMGGDFMEASQVDLHEAVSTLTLPVLVMTGSDDVILSPRHSRTLSRAIHQARLIVIAGGGHYVQVEQPQRVAQELDCFLQGR